MSEYQYYEWQTLGRPLTPAERAAVDALSSHIEVTSSQAVVTYSWGDFKHDPLQVLVRYFDVFLYLSSWGSKQLAFRFPKHLLPPQYIEPYLWEYAMMLKPVGDFLILNISVDAKEGGGWVEGEGWLSSLSWLRDDILQGDYRALYLAWLRAIELEDAEEDVLEPPVPHGLGELSPPLLSFVEFLDLDAYLLQAATLVSPPRQPPLPLPLEEAIVYLSPTERDAFLVRLARGEPHLSLALNRQLQVLTGGAHPAAADPSRRRWGALRATADRLRCEAERRTAAAAEAKRIAELQALASREAAIWYEVVALIEEKKSAAYDKAVVLLLQLHALAVHQARQADFRQRIAELQARYSNRPGLRARLQRAGLL